MKVFTVNGISNTGKTTTIEQIIKELKNRGYSVGTVKETHSKKFNIDTQGTDTFRHKEAGASLVTAKGIFETDILYQKMLPIYKILSFYDQDYVIMEGVNDINAPKIITAIDIEDVIEKLDYKAFMISGVIAEKMNEYKSLPVINSLSQIEKLVDMIEDKVPDILPDFGAECCGDCGLDCQAMLKKILASEKERKDCTINEGRVTLEINGKNIAMVPFVKNIMKNTILGVVKELEGYEEGKQINITIGQKI